MSEIACNTCVAACCKNTVIELTVEEQRFMEEGGTSLFTIAKPSVFYRERVLYPRGFDINQDGNIYPIFVRGSEYESLEAGLGRFILIGECGHLETDEDGWQYCGYYLNRPEACRTFLLGDKKCKLMRVLYDVDESSEEIPDIRALLS